jgi:hypothetical protein
MHMLHELHYLPNSAMGATSQPHARRFLLAALRDLLPVPRNVDFAALLLVSS